MSRNQTTPEGGTPGRYLERYRGDIKSSQSDDHPFHTVSPANPFPQSVFRRARVCGHALALSAVWARLTPSPPRLHGAIRGGGDGPTFAARTSVQAARLPARPVAVPGAACATLDKPVAPDATRGAASLASSAAVVGPAWRLRGAEPARRRR